MTEDEVFDKLDILLEILQSEKDAIRFNSILEIASKKDALIKGKFLKMALYKLKDDNYAYELVHQDDETNRLWSNTIEGGVFQLNGGYNAKALKDANDASWKQSEIDRLRTLDDLLGTNSTRLNGLTKWMAIGTWFAGFAALLLLGWQIVLWNYPLYKDFHNRTLSAKKDTVCVKMIK